MLLTARIFFNIILFLSVFFLPWWISILLGLIFVFIFSEYYEIIVLGLLLDSLYSETGSFKSALFTLAAVVVFIVAFEIRKRMRIYS
jgi:hypothetical protein